MVLESSEGCPLEVSVSLEPPEVEEPDVDGFEADSVGDSEGGGEVAVWVGSDVVGLLLVGLLLVGCGDPDDDPGVLVCVDDDPGALVCVVVLEWLEPSRSVVFVAVVVVPFGAVRVVIVEVDPFGCLYTATTTFDPSRAFLVVVVTGLPLSACRFAVESGPESLRSRPSV